MSTTSRETIIERIRKLMALAGNNSSEAERDAAMHKAQQLLIAHKIEESEIAAAESTTPIAEWVMRGRNGQWARRIAQSIGKLYFCGYISQAMGKKVDHIFVGKQTDAEIAKAVTNFVVESVYSEGARQMRARKANTSYWTSFVNAASLRIQARVRDMIRDSQNAESGASRALVVANLYATAQSAAADYIKNDPSVKTTKSRAMTNPSDSGWAQGIAFGDTIPITQQIGSGPKRIK